MDESVLLLHEKVGVSLAILEEEHAAEAIVKLFSSASIDSLNTSRDSTSSQLKEASALVVRVMSSYSPSMATTFINRNIFRSLVSTCADNSFSTPLNKGNWSSRSMPILGENSGSGSYSRPLEVHSEALDASIVRFISRILNSAQDFSPAKKRLHRYENQGRCLSLCICHVWNWTWR